MTVHPAAAAAADDPAAPARRSWTLERVLFALAGTMTLLSVALTVAVTPWFLLLTAFVGINQWLYVTVGNCPTSLIVRRLTGLEPGVPRAKADTGS